VRDHERVRRGETVVRPPRRVWLAAATVLAVSPQSVRLQVTCGGGFYVRSLARDLGEAMGTAAHVATLRRTAAGGFGLDDALPVDVLQALPRDGLRARVVPLLQAASQVLEVCPVDAQTALALRQGKQPVVPCAVAVARELLVTTQDEAVAIVHAEPQPDSHARLQVVRGFAHVATAAAAVSPTAG
jgi:tRNA pseudouridine55 synthase